jgi:hypothetical protein
MRPLDQSLPLKLLKARGAVMTTCPADEAVSPAWTGTQSTVQVIAAAVHGPRPGDRGTERPRP